MFVTAPLYKRITCQLTSDRVDPKRMRHLLPACLVTLACLSVASLGHADPIAKACIRAHADAQVLERDGKLLAAAQTLLECTSLACPNMIRTDCSAFAQRVADKTPTIVVMAQGAVGNALPLRELSIDGVALDPARASAAIPADPGPHVLRGRANDAAVGERAFSLEPGEKQHVVVLRLEPVSPAGMSQPAPKADRPLLAYGLTATSAVAFGAFALFAVKGKGTQADLEQTCVPHCTASQVQPMRTQYLVADVSLGVGVASALTAAYLFVIDGRPPAHANQRELTRRDPSREPADGDENGAKAQRLQRAGLGAAALGAVGLTLGTVFGVQAVSSYHQSQAQGCDHNDVCPPEALYTRRAARRAGTASTVSFIAGGALLAAGAGLYVSGANARSREPIGVSAQLTPLPSGGFASLGLHF